MANKRAKVLDPEQFGKLLAHIDTHSTMPVRDRLIVMLSFKAGLRVAEIAKIGFEAMTDAEGRVGRFVNVFSMVAKKNRERSIPMHPEIKKAFVAFRKAYPDAPGIAISSQPFQHGRRVGEKPTLRLMTPNTLAQYYRRLLIEAGFSGASSHSGRRTFATDAGRILATHHQSIRDLQKLMGHARLDTTETYLELSPDTFNLVAAL